MGMFASGGGSSIGSQSTEQGELVAKHFSSTHTSNSHYDMNFNMEGDGLTLDRNAGGGNNSSVGVVSLPAGDVEGAASCCSATQPVWRPVGPPRGIRVYAGSVERPVFTQSPCHQPQPNEFFAALVAFAAAFEAGPARVLGR